jgi:uncharacterized membrane protein YoaK (UPF0700 family)
MRAVAPDPRKTRAKSAVALLLTFAAGMVDIVGYINIYHLFTAHMTGTTVHLGNKLVTGDWAEVEKAAAVIGAFVVGSICGRMLIEAAAANGLRRVASILFATQGLLLAAFIWIGSGLLGGGSAISVAAACGLLALLSAAMGLQTAALTRIGPLTIHTTFVTGMINKFAQAVSKWLFWAYAEFRKGTNASELVRRSARHSAVRDAQFMFGIWFCYMSGAVAGTWMNSRWRLAALYVPVAILVASIAIDQSKPLSIEEEIDEAQGKS